MIDLIHIGHTSKAKGIDGAFRVKIEHDRLDDLAKARALFIDLDGSKVPFLIHSVDTNSQVLIKLEEIDSPESVNPLLHKEIYLEAKEVTIQESSDTSSDHDLIGYTVIDEEENLIGRIIGIKEYPEQILAEVETKKGLSLIPLHIDFIAANDPDRRVMQLQLPEGLLDL